MIHHADADAPPLTSASRHPSGHQKLGRLRRRLAALLFAPGLAAALVVVPLGPGAAPASAATYTWTWTALQTKLSYNETQATAAGTSGVSQLPGLGAGIDGGISTDGAQAAQRAEVDGQCLEITVGWGSALAWFSGYDCAAN